MKTSLIFAGFLLLISGNRFAAGCSLQSIELRRVSPEFTVIVKHGGKGIGGATAEVFPEKTADSVLSAKTDVHGVIRIRELMPGRYYVTASLDDLDAGKEWIEVAAIADAKTSRQIIFHWADWSYEARRVAGTLKGLVPGDTGKQLMNIVHPKETVYSGVQMTLRNAFSDVAYNSVSDSEGAFFFEVPDGTYIMTITGGMKSITGTADTTTLVVDVKRSAPRNSIPLQLKDNGCYRTEFELAEN